MDDPANDQTVHKEDSAKVAGVEDPPWIFIIAVFAVVCTIVIVLVADNFFHFLPTLYSEKST